MVASTPSTTIRSLDTSCLHAKKAFRCRAFNSSRPFSSQAKCSWQVEDGDKKSFGSDILMPLIGTSLAAGLTLTTLMPQNAFAETTFRSFEPQPVALIAEVEFAEESVAPAVENDSFSRARELKAILAQKRIEAEEKAAAAKAESDAIAKANSERLALEAAAKKAQSKPAETEKVVSTPAVASSKPVSAPAPATAVSKKTHGGTPLLLAQFLVLAAYGGSGYALLKVPASTWKTASEAIESTAAKVSPKVEEAIEKYTPAVEKGVEISKQLAVEAQPYVVKAVEAAKPLALEAVEKAKPLVKKGQEKASALFAQAQEKLKSSLKSSEGA